MDPNRCPVVIEDEHRASMRRHISCYLGGGDFHKLGVEKKRFIDLMMSEYEDIRCSWNDENLLNFDMTSTGHSKEIRSRFRSNPLMHWISGRCSALDEPLQQKAHMELRSYAKRILCVSPTETATERSFAHLNRLHTHQRSRMKRETIETLLFCQWNERVLSENASYPWISRRKVVEDQISSLAALRLLKKKVSKLVSSLPPEPSDAEIQEANRTAQRFALETVHINRTQMRQHNHGDTLTVETNSGNNDGIDQTVSRNSIANESVQPGFQEHQDQHQQQRFFVTPQEQVGGAPVVAVTVPQQQTGLYQQIINSAPTGRTGAWLQTPFVLAPQPLLSPLQTTTGLPAVGFSIGIPQNLAAGPVGQSQMIYTPTRPTTQPPTQSEKRSFKDEDEEARKKRRNE